MSLILICCTEAVWYCGKSWLQSHITGRMAILVFTFVFTFLTLGILAPLENCLPLDGVDLNLIFLFYGSCHTLIGAALNIWFSQGRGLMQPPSQQFCDTCKVMLNSPEQAHQHYQGARHAKRLKLVVKGPRNGEHF